MLTDEELKAIEDELVAILNCSCGGLHCGAVCDRARSLTGSLLSEVKRLRSRAYISPDDRHTRVNAHGCCEHDPKKACCDNHPAESPQPAWLSPWISVEERLPDDVPHLQYITMPRDDGFPGTQSQMVALYGFSGEISPYVTHWMPLPEPPAESVFVEAKFTGETYSGPAKVWPLGGIFEVSVPGDQIRHDGGDVAHIGDLTVKFLRWGMECAYVQMTTDQMHDYFARGGATWRPYECRMIPASVPEPPK